MKTALAALALGLLAFPAVAHEATSAGIYVTRSAHSAAETAARIRAAIEDKAIQFFDAIDQAALAREAGLDIAPAIQAVFGNPPLRALFPQSDPRSGLNWPVRMQVSEDAGGTVHVAYQDWDFVAARWGIADRAEEYETATGVVAAIVGTVADCAALADCTR